MRFSNKSRQLVPAKAFVFVIAFRANLLQLTTFVVDHFRYPHMTKTDFKKAFTTRFKRVSKARFKNRFKGILKEVHFRKAFRKVFLKCVLTSVFEASLASLKHLKANLKSVSKCFRNAFQKR